MVGSVPLIAFRATSPRHVALSIATAVCAVLFCGDVVAGGSTSGPGLLASQPTTKPLAAPVDRSRLDIALEYAFADPTVSDKLEGFMLKASMNGIPTNYVSFTTSFKKAVEVAMIGYTDLTYLETLRQIRRSLELVVEGLGGPITRQALPIGELAVAFTFSFLYGYFLGQ